MDERIDLTENRDFRKRSIVRMSNLSNDSFIMRTFIFRKIMNSNILYEITSDDEMNQLSSERRHKSIKIYLRDTGEICADNFYQEDGFGTCARCGRRIIQDYYLCAQCELDMKDIRKEIFKKEELRSVEL